MSDSAPEKKLPALRFPEFSDRGGFEETALNRLLFETKSRNTDGRFKKEEVLSVSGEFGCVNQIEHLGRSYAGVSVDNYHVVETGDIVYTKSPLKSSPFGIIKENKKIPGIVSTLYAVYRTTDLANPSYLEHFFSSNFNLNVYLQPLVNKGAKNDMKVKNSEVLTGKIFAPKVDEQSKIAECLTSLQDLIVAEEENLAELRSLKLVMMQELFPRNGARTPRQRFPEFMGTGDWKPRNFSEVFERITRRNDSGCSNVLTISGQLGLISQLDYFNKSVSAQDLSGYYHIRKGEFAYNKSYSAGYPMGAIKRLNRYDQGVVSTLYICFGILSEDSPEFLEQYFDSGVFNAQIEQIAQEGARNHGLLNVGVTDFFQNTSLLLPKIDEQRKIAACLSEVDAEISTQEAKVSGLKDHRDGLRQRLMPSPRIVGA